MMVFKQEGVRFIKPNQETWLLITVPNPCCYRIIINLLVDEGTSRDACTIDWEGLSMGRVRSMHSDVKVAIFMNVFCISFKGRIKMDP